MAVFTTVPQDALQAFLRSFDIGVLKEYTGIETGVENTNYRLDTDQGRYILTLFETRIRASALPFCFKFMEHLRKGGISCPRVVKDEQGYETRILCDRPTSILTFLDGKAVEINEITPQHCFEIGQTLAKMHISGAQFEAYRPNPVGPDMWSSLYTKTVGQADEVETGLSDKISDVLIDAQERRQVHFPFGAVHADLFPDNVFFQDNKVSGVIDFYFSCTDSLIYDAALTFNAWCGCDEFALDENKAKAFWEGYRTHRRLTSLELKYFPDVQKMAALRILLTRLHDWIFQPEDNVLVVAKDPREYSAIMDWDKKILQEVLHD